MSHFQPLKNYYHSDSLLITQKNATKAANIYSKYLLPEKSQPRSRSPHRTQHSRWCRTCDVGPSRGLEFVRHGYVTRCGERVNFWLASLVIERAEPGTGRYFSSEFWELRNVDRRSNSFFFHSTERGWIRFASRRPITRSLEDFYRPGFPPRRMDEEKTDASTRTLWVKVRGR